jgi:hypothetical protein
MLNSIHATIHLLTSSNQATAARAMLLPPALHTVNSLGSLPAWALAAMCHGCSTNMLMLLTPLLPPLAAHHQTNMLTAA